MGSAPDKNTDVAFDSEGFLLHKEAWNEDVARRIAANEGLDDLSEEQMEIISFMRRYYTKYKVFPILNNVCKVVHQPKHCVNEQFINPELAWKIAGLPKQEGFHFITLDGGKSYRMESCC